MATESKDVELRVRAKDYSQKTLDAVTKAIEDLTKAQAEQLAAAKKGEVSAKTLADSYTKIEQAVQALISQHSLTKTFQAQAEALQISKDKADQARIAQTEYANSLANVEEKTKKQITQQERLARAVVSADNAQLNAQNRLDRTVAKLEKFGIATTDIGVAQKKMADGVAVGNAALELQSKALDTIEIDTRQAAASATLAAEQRKKAAEEEVLALRRVADAAAAAAAVQAKNQASAARDQILIREKLVAERALRDSIIASTQQAEANAKSYSTLARSVKSVRGDELAAQLREIVAPAATANENMAGLTTNIDKLAKTVAAIKGPVKDFRATLASLEATQKGAAGIAAQIDGYKRQIDVLRAARIEYSQAQAAVRNLTQQMRAGGGDAAVLAKELNTAQSALRSAAQNISNQVTVTRQLRTALTEAGVDTRKLSDAEIQLIANAQKATVAIQQLSAAYKQHGAAADDSTKKTFKFFEGQRTTLSYAQRLRGELLALATAYIGIQGAIGLATGAIETFGQVQKIQGQLGAAFGTDAKTIATEWKYLMDTANRIGISFKEAAPAYAKFAIAGKAFGFSGQEIRYVFEQVAKASRVAGLSGSEFEGVLKALEQMLSKGTIQAEELRGQLGDRLPGAFSTMAKAIGLTEAELTKLMEKGGLTADALIPFARELPNRFKATQTATEGMLASQANFNNALFEFKQLIAESGFADAYIVLLKKMSEFFKSDDGLKFAKGLSDAFALVVKGIVYLIDHIDYLKIAFSVLTGLLVAKWAYAASVAVIALGTSLKAIYVNAVQAFTILGTGATVFAAAGAGATTAAVGVRTLSVAIKGMLGPLGLLLIAIEAAMFAYDMLSDKSQNPGGKKTGKPAAFTGGATGDFSTSKDTPDPGTGATAGSRAAAEQAKEAEKRQKKLAKDRKSAMKKDAKDDMEERADLIKEEFDLYRKQANEQITDAAAKSKQLLLIDKQEKFALETDRIKYQAEHAKANASAASKEVTLKETVKNALLKIQDDITNAEVKVDKDSTFDERKKARLDAIAHSYDKLKKTISQLSATDKTGAADASKKLDTYIKQLQAVESIKATTDEVKRLEKELDDQTKLRQAGLDKEKAKYDAGLISQEQFLANTAEINTRGDTAVTVAAENLQKFVDAAVKAKADILSLTEQSEIGVKTTSAIAAASGTSNKIADASNKAQEEAIDALVAKRTAAEQIYKAQFELRMIDEDEYARKVNENADQHKAKILELNTAFLQQLETQRAQGILEGTLNPQRLAALDALIAKQQLLGVTTANAAKQADTLTRSLTQGLGQGLDNALNGIATSLTNMATSTTSVAEGFRNMALAGLAAFGQLLQQIAVAIAKQLILNALASNFGGGFIGVAAKAAGGVMHRGGTVGAANGTKRAVDPSWFVGAPRFHEGGFPGLKSDEVPTILQAGEQVLARNDPNNALNPKARNSAGTRFVLVDDRSKVPEAMQSAEGEEVIVQTLRRNAATVKQFLR